MSSKHFHFYSLSALATVFLSLTCIGQSPTDKSLAGIAQRSFASPEAATNELIMAAEHYDQRAIYSIFGQEITNLLTGDKVLDQRHFQSFVSNLLVRCDTVRDDGHKVILEIGQDKWQFPIPLVETDGTWKFDTAAGVDEIMNRHIGRDEYYAIGVCRAYVKAQRQYADKFSGNGGTPKYAEKLESSPGKTDGLYWAPDADAGPSPFSAVVAKATIQGYGWTHRRGPEPFHGYYFKILTQQGPAAPGGKKNYVHHGEMTDGFALIAYPVRFGESGIMTFIVNQDGIVYQRCLHEDTLKSARAIKEYNPDSNWTVVNDPGMTDLAAK